MPRILINWRKIKLKLFLSKDAINKLTNAIIILSFTTGYTIIMLNNIKILTVYWIWKSITFSIYTQILNLSVTLFSYYIDTCTATTRLYNKKSPLVFTDSTPQLFCSCHGDPWTIIVPPPRLCHHNLSFQVPVTLINLIFRLYCHHLW